MQGVLVRISFVGLLLSACSSATTAPAQIQALVAFNSSLDTTLLGTAGLEVLGVFTAPPVALVIGTSDALDRVGQHPQVAYVARFPDLSDSLEVFVRFRDRPTTADTVTDVDRALIPSLGGYIRYVYDIIPDVAAIIPLSALQSLQASPLIAKVAPAGPPGHIH